MKTSMVQLYVGMLLLLAACGNNPTDAATATVTSSAASQQNGIVGEWDQQYTCFDKNGNYKLEAEEKKPSGTRLGFDWFRFNGDGSCLRDKNIKLKGNYAIEEKSGTKKLVIQGSDNLRYTITALTKDELILGTNGAFIVFSRK